MWKDILKGEKNRPTEKELDKRIMRYYGLTEEEFKNIPKKDMQAFLVDVMKNPLNYKELRNILKGEEIHPSVKGFETKAKTMYARLRKDMIKFQKEIEEIEKLIDTDVWEKTPKIVQDRVLEKIKDYKKKIESRGKIIGSKFNPKHPKYESTVNQRLTPTTKKPKVERMKRPAPDNSIDTGK